MNAQPQSTVDERNPWLGLASFTEETRQYFYGREEEIAELARRVQRKLLTVLFGQSGLGKTSILRAGLVPRLRGQGYCPVYVRIDYGREAPEPAEQIKQAIVRTARSAGEWTQVGVAAVGESLWEFLHHRGDELRDESGATLIPLLIFDQFEEIFTLAQSDDFGRARAARFVADLADLVENRPPKELEAQLEQDESTAERFDFGRSDYRVVIALREDYLAPLESLKNAMPSITQNRLRLAPMTGRQALAAVVQPGKGLVSEEVAAAIVRFVAGDAEIANAEVEPSLLSLICRELNDTRIGQGRSEISLDLLAGSHASILSNFYERSLADQPAAVRRIIEDELLTASGFRENIAEERLLNSFKAVGAGPETLAVLVNRRLLRIEERLDVRRVELTHDVLCGVVKSSRDQRREREGREATDRLLAEQRERELAARRALVRARQVASVCIVLAIGALAAAVFAYFSSQRALRAERQAQETRAIAEQARAQAETLLGYLTDDFTRELETFGRLDLVAEFAKRQIDYFHALPPALKDTETTRNGALAMAYYAKSMRTLGRLELANPAAGEAVTLLEQLRSAGDHSDATTIALAQAMVAQSAILDNMDDPAGPTVCKRAAQLILPLANAPQPSAAVRRTYAEVLVRLGFEQVNDNEREQAVSSLQHAQQLALALGARDPKSPDMGALYAEASAWLTEALQGLGRSDEARQVGTQAVALANDVLARRPGYRLALHAQQVIESSLVDLAADDLNPAQALREGQRTEQVSLTLLNLDPNNVTTLNNLGVAHQGLGDALWAAGRVRESIPYYLKSVDDATQASRGGAGFVIIRSYFMGQTALHQALLGDGAAAEATLAAGAPALARLQASEAKGSIAPVFVELLTSASEAGVALERNDAATARRVAWEVVSRLQTVKADGGLQEFQKYENIYLAAGIAGQAEYLLGDFVAAERGMRAAIEARKNWPTQSTADRRDQSVNSIWLAMALARQGHFAEAMQIIEPVTKYQRELAARNHGDQWQRVELASALYAQSLAARGSGASALPEAASLVAALPAPMRDMRIVRFWHDRIREAQHAPGAAMTRAVIRGEG
jgi:tetratricopeptide (TPR) repeat protein